jgi:uncharacterized RDD family membrane protein YckC
MTTPEPPEEPTPPSFEKPAPGGSPYGTPPPYGGQPPYGHRPPNGSAQPGAGTPLYDPGRSGTNPYGPTPYGNAQVAAMPPLGGLGRRLTARIIDYVLLAVVGVPLTLLAYSGSSHDRTARTVGVDVVLALVGFVYEGLMLTLSRGQTVGKKVMRVRVAVLADGAVPSGSTGWIRSAVFWLPGIISFLCIPALFSLLNILWCLWDRPYRQCLHDKAAKTVVVRTD